MEIQRHIANVLAMILVMAGCSGAADGDTKTRTPPEAVRITVLHMTDAHAHYLPYKEKGRGSPVGGFAKAQTVIKGIRKKNLSEGRHTLLLFAGDLLMGTIYSTTWKGKVGIELLNAMGIDAMVVGNHEFDYGQENLFQVLKPMCRFPLLSANIKDAEGKYPFQRLIEKTVPGFDGKVVIFGLTTTETPVTTHPSNVKGIVLEDEIATARRLLEPYGQEDLIIALTHIGVEADKALAAALPKIDVVIGGHSHVALFSPIKRGNALICQAFAYSRYVGRLDLEVVNGEVVKHNGELISLEPGLPEDSEISAIIAGYSAQLDARLKAPIGKTAVLLDGSREAVRSNKKSDLCMLIGSIMAANAGADVGIINGGGIRDSLYRGVITTRQVYEILPFGDSIVSVALTGKDLEAIVQRSHDLPMGHGGKLQIYGITSSVKDGRTRIEEVRGKIFDPSKMYRIATNDFLYRGGDGYDIFKKNGTKMVNTGLSTRDLLIDFIKRKGIITRKLVSEIH